VPPILFTAATLTALSGRAVTDDQAAEIHAWVVTVVEGEIGALTDPPPPGVIGVALEVGVAAVPVPGGVASTTLGSFSTTYTTTRPGDALTTQQRRRLRRSVGKNRAFSIDTTQTP
jgi:hypothetical protein